MGEFAEAYPIVSLFLIHFMRATLLVGALWLITSLLKGASAAVRSGIWNLGLISLLTFPLLSIVLPGWDVSFLLRDESSKSLPFLREAVADSVAAPPGALRLIDVSSPPSRVATEASDSPGSTNHYSSFLSSSRISYVVLSLWGIGVIVLCVFWWKDYRAAGSILRKACPVTSGSLLDSLEAMLKKERIKRRVLLVHSSEVHTPMTIGIWRPVIVLPDVASEWSDALLKATLLHELAHIKRLDLISYAMVHATCVLYWMNPLVWMARSRIKYEQEKACDDRVVLSGIHSVEYAEHLLSVAKWARKMKGAMPASHAIAMAQEHMLKKRMRSILSSETSRKPFTRLHRIGVAACIVSLAVPLAAVTLQPEEWQHVYLWYEAEEGGIAGQMEIRSDDASSNFQYVTAKAGAIARPDAGNGALTIHFTIPRSGEYIIWGRILAPSKDANSFFVSVDEGEPLLWDTYGPDREMTAKVWSWDRVRNRESAEEEGGEPIPFYFEKGRHSLRIIGREKGTGIDKILITDNPVYRPRSKGMTTGVIKPQYVWLEPENGNVDLPMQVDRDPRASNEWYVWTPENNGNPDGKGVAHLRFRVDQADSYILWGRVLAPTPSDNSFFISVDGGEEILWDVRGPDRNNTAKAWWWDRMRDREKAKQMAADSLVFGLEPGWHTLSVRSREAGTRLDRILVTNDETFIPEGWGTAPDELTPVYLWMEAEDAELKAPLIRGADAGASNGAYIEVIAQKQSRDRPPKDGHANFYVHVPVDGTYLLWGRVLAPSSGNSFWLRVDGKRWIRWNGIRHGTGWHWEEVHDNSYNNRVLSIELQAGSHLFEIAYREKNTKLDGFLLTNDFNYVPAASLDEPVVQKREQLVSAFRE